LYNYKLSPIFKLLLVLILFSQVLLAVPISYQSEAKKVATFSSVFLYNMDYRNLSSAIRPFMNDKTIVAIEIDDSISKERIYTIYRDKNKLHENSKIPKNILNNASVKHKVIYHTEKVGTLTLYYIKAVNEATYLTQEEKNWIKTNTITVGVEQWDPIVFLNSSSNIDGLSGDFIKKIANKTGLKMTFISDTWDNLLSDFKNKKIDLLPATYYTKEREKIGFYSTPYFKVKDYIYVKDTENNIQSLKDLNGKKLAIEKEYGTIPRIQKNFPNIKLVITTDIDDSIHKVLSGEVDAFYESGITAEKKFLDEFIVGLKGFPIVSFKVSKLHFLSTINKPILQSILQKSLDSISTKENNEILSNWFLVEKKQSHKISLTKKEEKWIQKHPLIHFVADPNWAPFEFLNVKTGKSSGIAQGYLKYISQKTGLKFELTKIKNWDDGVRKINNRESDMFSCVKETAQRAKILNFSDHYLNFPVVMITDNTKNYLPNVAALNGKKVVLIKGYAITGIIQKDYPKIDILLVENIKQALQKVSDGDAYAYISTLPAASYNINKHGFFNLKVTGKTEYQFPLSIALRNDWDKTGINIINKALRSITKEGKDAIYNRWVSITFDEEVDYTLLWQISGVFLLLMIVALYWHRKQQKLLKEVEISQRRFSALFNLSPDGIAILNEKGIFVDCNEMVLKLYGVKTREDFIGTTPDLYSPLKQELGKLSADASKQHMKDLLTKGTQKFEWIHKNIDTDETFDAEIVLSPVILDKQIFVIAIVRDISERKYLEFEIIKQKEFVQTLLDSQEQLIITTDGKTLLSANETFFDFFAVDSTDDFIQTYDAKCICNTFNTKAPEDYLQIKMGKEEWIDYVISRSFDITHKVMISRGSVDYIFSVTAAKLPGNDGIKSAVFTNITEMEKAKVEIDEINKHTRESIEYAALIQSALIPNNNDMRKYFKDQFVIWQPKDTVGGDIYLFDELRHEDECLLMVIDCTGHGVPGAFVTMLVKAIEREITAKIITSDEIVSPSKILSIFNKKMKQLLKQESIDSISNSGFDGGIIYYNKKEKIIKYAGAETALFYVKDDELKVIKGNRYSVGYKKCSMDYEYQEHTIEVKEEMRFYLSTDGYLDQNGGEKGFCFGKKKFQNIINEYYLKTMADQQEIFLNKLEEYQGKEETNDDITLVGFKI